MEIPDQTASRLSESILWKLQEAYYQTLGVSAFEKTPFFITSNKVIAKAYAEVIVGFLSDYYDYLDRDEPVYLLELAAGTGAFGFYLLQELEKQRGYFKKLHKLKLRYVMTDFSESLKSQWQHNTALKPYMEKGILDFATFRPDEQKEFSLASNYEIIKPGVIKNPLITVANYLFCGTKQDVFQVQNGQLTEARYTFFTDTENEAPTLANIQFLVDYHPVTLPYYDDRDLDGILQNLAHRYDNATFLFPLDAIKALKTLNTLSSGNLVTLISDKGFTWPEYMMERWDQTFDRHGSISFLLNFPALDAYFTLHKGSFLSTTDKTLSLQTALGMLLEKETALEHTICRFQENIINENPVNHLYFLKSVFTDAAKDPESMLQAILSYLDLTGSDPTYFEFVAPLLNQVLENPYRIFQREALVIHLDKISQSTYDAPHAQQIHYWLSETYKRLKIPDKAAFHLTQHG